ncbi:MAG: TIGR00159 family protein [Ardenticatenales bacterium]|nr:TIGR00159 family protein [Ardenticatenales bacterium]
MSSALEDILLSFSTFQPSDAIDILLVTLVIYGVLYFVRGTQAVQLLRGVMVLVVTIIFLSTYFKLTAFNWLIRNSLPGLFVAIPVIFQPEIRRGLERLGRTSLFFQGNVPEPEITRTINRVCRAAQRLSDTRLGALIVFERESGLQDIINTGVLIDSLVTPELLLTIFFTNTPLHDGAVIIRANRIMAAASVLPLAADLRDRRLGTRHRAAVGVTDSTDAIVVVVSEETGTISLAYNGRLIRHLDEGRLNRLLHAFYGPQKPGGIRHWLMRHTVTPESDEGT